MTKTLTLRELREAQDLAISLGHHPHAWVDLHRLCELASHMATDLELHLAPIAANADDLQLTSHTTSWNVSQL